MSNLLKYLAYGIGAFVLFIGSFLAFAAFSGTPMHEMAVIGGLFPEPAVIQLQASAETKPLAELQNDVEPANETIEKATSPLQAFVLEGPLTATEMDRLQQDLKNQIRANELKSLELEKEDKKLAMLEKHLEERWEELEKIRTNLMTTELSLQQRDDELRRDEDAKAEKEADSWVSLAKVFADGKPKDLSEKLQQYTPEDAAKILRALPGERAASLLNEIPVAAYKTFADAYRKAEFDN